MNHQRRGALKTGSGLGVFSLLVAAGMIKPEMAQAAWNKTAFEAKTLDAALAAVDAGKPAESADVVITAPDIAENGAVVPVGCASSLPGVKRLLILVEKNPNMLCAMFDVSDSVEPSFNTRVKMGQSSNVMAVAITADNKVLFSHKEIKVTLGGCGG